MGADYLTVVSDFVLGTDVELLEGHAKFKVHIRPGLLLLLTTENVAKDVSKGIHLALRLINALLATPIILTSLISIAQHLVGSRDISKFIYSLLAVRVLIWVPFQRHSAVGFLDVGG